VDSVAYNALIIGEASNKIPLSVRKMYPLVLWRILKDIRNKNIHEYDTLTLRSYGKWQKQVYPR